MITQRQGMVIAGLFFGSAVALVIGFMIYTLYTM